MATNPSGGVMPEKTVPKWEEFAQDDPEVYIWAKRREGSSYQRDFFGSGRHEVPGLLSRVEPYLQGRDQVVEYGSGVGRLLIPMSEHFGAALGVDISPTMLAKLEQNAREQGANGIATT